MLAVVVFAALPALAVADREAPGAFGAPSICAAVDADPSATYASTEAPAGGAFWLRLDDVGDPLQGALDLVDAAGARRATFVVFRGHAVVAIAAPDDAPVGAVYALHHDGQPVPSVSLRVVAPPDVDAPLEIVEVVAVDPVAATCADATCAFGGGGARVLAFDATFAGGPGLVDAFVTFPGGAPLDDQPRTVEARFVDPAATTGPVRLEVGPAVVGTASVDVRFVARSLSGAAGDSELVAIVDAPHAPDEEPLPDCAIDDRCVADQGCGFSACASPFALLLALRLRRRPASSSAR